MDVSRASRDRRSGSRWSSEPTVRDPSLPRRANEANQVVTTVGQIPARARAGRLERSQRAARGGWSRGKIVRNEPSRRGSYRITVFLTMSYGVSRHRAPVWSTGPREQRLPTSQDGIAAGPSARETNPAGAGTVRSAWNNGVDRAESRRIRATGASPADRRCCTFGSNRTDSMDENCCRLAAGKPRSPAPTRGDRPTQGRRITTIDRGTRPRYDIRRYTIRRKTGIARRGE